MSWEHTVQSKRAARKEAFDAALESLPPNVAGHIDVERIDGKTLVSRLARGEVTAEQVTIKAIHK